MSFALLPTQRAYTVATIDRCCWLTIVGCENGHSATWSGADLLARFPAEAVIGVIADRLKCSVCGSTAGSIGFVQDHSPEARRRTMRKEDRT